ncbi:unnamed protein product [Merluccius merluccius]
MEAPLLFLLTVLTGLGEGQQVMMWVKPGEDVSLACLLPANCSRSTLSWYQRKEQHVAMVLSFTQTSPPRVTYGRGFGPDRFTLDPHQRHHLLLLHSKPSDAGVYFCAITTSS